MKDIFQEILITMRMNKMRTFLTGFAIAWGIFMLVVLLACGNGLQNAMMNMFSYSSKNSVTLYFGYTSMPYNGMKKGRRINATNEDMQMLERIIPQSSNFSPFMTHMSSLSNGNLYIGCSVNGVKANYINIRSLEIVSGRFINSNDEFYNNKVIVIGEKTAQSLFPAKDPIGEYVRMENMLFKVIGVYSEMGGENNQSAYVPYSMLQITRNTSKRLYELSFLVKGVNNAKQADEYTEKIRSILANYYNFDPQDTNAVWIRNRVQGYEQTQLIFGGIAMFIWIIGLGTLTAGVVGVSNIMLITVKERTKEFGIRKALGATPNSILFAVLLESLVITASFGYFGLLSGIGVSEILCMIFPAGQMNPENPTFMMNPTVDISVAMSATLVLVVAGLLAGYFPARKAVTVKPIEAMMAK